MAIGNFHDSGGGVLGQLFQMSNELSDRRQRRKERDATQQFLQQNAELFGNAPNLQSLAAVSQALQNQQTQANTGLIGARQNFLLGPQTAATQAGTDATRFGINRQQGVDQESQNVLGRSPEVFGLEQSELARLQGNRERAAVREAQNAQNRFNNQIVQRQENREQSRFNRGLVADDRQQIEGTRQIQRDVAREPQTLATQQAGQQAVIQGQQLENAINALTALSVSGATPQVQQQAIQQILNQAGINTQPSLEEQQRQNAMAAALAAETGQIIAPPFPNAVPRQNVAFQEGPKQQSFQSAEPSLGQLLSALADGQLSLDDFIRMITSK